MDQKQDQKAEYPNAGLILPARTEQKSSFFHKPAAVSDWLEKLPLASPLECSKSLFKTLFEMNRINLASELRIKILEDMLNPIEIVTNNLKSKYVTTTFPLNEKNRKIALLTRELYKEVLIGYKAAIAEQIETGSAKSQQSPHIVAVHRALSYLYKVLFHSYIIYEPYPVHIWREIHLLFTYSSLNKIDRIPVKDENAEPATASTAKQVYIKTLLLAAASPYQLRQRETDQLDGALGSFSSLAKLSIRHVKDSDNDIGFLINLHSDKPPVPIAYATKQENRQLFVLDTRKLLEKIQHSLTQASEDNMSGMSTHLKQLLLKNWGHAPHRHYVRTRLNFDLNVAIGLNEIHELIETGQASPENKNLYLGKSDSILKPQDNLQRSSLFLTDDEDEDITILTMGNYDSPEKNRGTFLSTQKIEKELQINGDELLSESHDGGNKRTHECKTVNESSGGYCIEWPQKNTPGIRVGELIGIQSATHAVEFGLAITRWLKSLPDNSLMVGIEIISHKCKATKARIDEIVPKHKTATYYPALTIPQTADAPSYVIVPSDLFNSDKVLLLKNQHEMEERIKLSKLIESTGLFSLYETTTLASTSKPRHSQLIDESPILSDK